MPKATTGYKCHFCEGAKKITVSREFSQDKETCPWCKGTGIEPERFVRLIKVREVIDSFHDVIGGSKKRIWYTENGGALRVVANVDILGLFWSELDFLGDYRPRLDQTTGDAVWLIFEPVDD